jgi:nitronate monooxygenase
MNRIERRAFMKCAVAGAFASSTAIANGALASEAQRQVELPRMGTWPNRRLLDLLKVQHPIIQAPMGGHVGADMVVAVAEAGGLGSLPSARSTAKQLRDAVAKIRSRTRKPLNLNFLCHAIPKQDEAKEASWHKRLARYYAELGLNAPETSAILGPFNAEMCDTVVELKPEIVSFMFGLPDTSLVKRIKAAGCLVLSTATTVEEARWLEDHGTDAVIAQGADAGGHRAMFLKMEAATQVGTLALVPQIVDAVKIPVIAAGGIADGRGIAAAFALGAAGVQCGTAYLFCPESTITPVHRASLKTARDNSTAISTVFTGRPARVIVNRIMRDLGLFPDDVPEFPLAFASVHPLALKAEKNGSSDFTLLYCGQAATLCREIPARDLTLKLAAQALEKLAAGHVSSVR